jgi:hypothetical protein
LCFMVLILLSWSTLLKLHALCHLSPIAFQARSPVYALKRTHMRAVFLRCVKFFQFESFVWCANLASIFCTWSSAFIYPFLQGSQNAAPYSRIGRTSDM